MDALDWIYLNGHFIVTFLVLAFIYARRNHSFYFVRNMFMIAMALAVIGYWLYPTAPPRLMPEWGFTDAISQFDWRPQLYRPDRPAFVNFYAAVPSMHVCFAVIVGGSMCRLIRWRPGKILWRAVPASDHVRGRRHRQPLLHRRIPRGPHRRRIRAAGQRLLARARPDVWAFSPAPVDRLSVAEHVARDRLTMPEQTEHRSGPRSPARRAGSGRRGPVRPRRRWCATG